MSSESLKFNEDTIAAVATGIGGSISVIRLSGKSALEIAARIWVSKQPLSKQNSRKLVLGRIINDAGTVEDECMAVYMPAPNSYTGEDIIEFHCHGGTLVSRTVLSILFFQGARHADAGEFTLRAFLNGKIDLTQAEAVMDIIQAQSKMALHAANRQLQGLLRLKVDRIYENLTRVLAEVEVRMDFCDEELDWQTVEQLTNDLEKTAQEIDALIEFKAEGEVLRNGVRVVIVGAPNAGKSSLLNLLLGRDRAIVTAIPGTTRDTLEEPAHIRGIPVKVIDTAGIRESDDVIEKEGIARSKSSIDSAQLVLWVLDSTRDLDSQRFGMEALSDKPTITVANKIDIVDNVPFENDLKGPIVKISALTGTGLSDLFDAVEKMVWEYPHEEEPEIAVSARHCALLESARDRLAEAREIIEDEEFELIAIQLRSTIEAIGKISGRTMQPDILENIFHSFCIGK